MFSLFKRKLTAEPTFTGRVERFWNWYADAAPRLFETIEQKRSIELEPEISAQVDQLVSGCAWCFGVGNNGQGHSFTLTGEANPHRQFLTEFWRSMAPPLPGWTFYSARQPSPTLDKWRLEIGGATFEPLEFWITPHLDKDEEKIDLAIWHPHFSKIAERDRWTVVFLVLDEALGEFGTQSWIGQIDVIDSKLADAFPLQELPAFVKKTETDTGWEKLSPTDTWTGYRLKEPHNRFRRGDIIVGSTCHTALLNEFLQSEDRLEDPLAGTGAEYVFVTLDSSYFPKGQEVATRGRIEDALIETLGSARSGRHLGGAMGAEHVYIDLMLFDGERSLDIVRDVLRSQSVPKGTAIEFFAHAGKARRTLL